MYFKHPHQTKIWLLKFRMTFDDITYWCFCICLYSFKIYKNWQSLIENFGECQDQRELDKQSSASLPSDWAPGVSWTTNTWPKKNPEKNPSSWGTMLNGSPVLTHSWRIWGMYFVLQYGNNFYFLQTFLLIKMIDSTVLHTR